MIPPFGTFLVDPATSIVFFVANPWARLALALLGVALAAWLYRVPSRDAPEWAAAESGRSE